MEQQAKQVILRDNEDTSIGNVTCYICEENMEMLKNIY